MRRTVAAIAVALFTVAGSASARFVSTDPVQANSNNGTNFNRYNYANNNPYRFTDPDGREFKSVNPADNRRVEGYINANAAGNFKFNDSNTLERTGNNLEGGGSQTYNDALVQGISSDRTILIAIQATVGDINVDDHGGGLTGQVGGNLAVVISNNVLETQDASGAPLVDLPSDILAHEIASHAVPQALGNINGNAVDIDNQIRSEQNAPTIPSDPTHKTYDPL